MKYFQQIKLLAVWGMFALLVGCSSDDGTAPAAYSGVETQAAVTTANSSDFADATVDSADSGSNSANASAGEGDRHALMMRFVGKLPSMVQHAETGKESGSSGGASAAIQSSSDTVDGPCGGTMTTSFSIDDVTFEWTGSISYSAYCEEPGSKMDGSVSFEGNLSSSTFTFGALTYSDATESFTLSGTMVMSGIPGSTGSVYTFTMNMDVRDNNAGETVRMADMVMTVNEYSSSGYDTVSMAGKVYHAEHGYVTVSTTTNITMYYNKEYPSAGVLVLTGSGNTSVRLTFNADGTYTKDIDENGDTTYETTQTCTWSTGACV